MIETGMKGRTKSAEIENLSLNASFSFKSLQAAKSSGEFEGTEVTTPVPLPGMIDIIGKRGTRLY